MKKLYLILPIFVLLLVACKENSAENESIHDHMQHNPLSGDLQELTASGELPSFLDSQQEEVVMVYQLALQYADVLDWIPCYCGCGETAAHRSNLNCFIKERNEDGSVVWDDHGTRCLVCLEIALQSAKLSKEGKSIEEIRTIIDETYQEGYEAPTPTPTQA